MPEDDLLSLFATPLGRVGVKYMVTGATAAILYGQPRTTNDVDIVLELQASDLPRLRAQFPDTEYYLPPDEVILVELGRSQRGHLNILHLPSGFKADLYPVGSDPLHAWALPRARTVKHQGQAITFAPPDYVIVRKLEYYREGGSTKHLTDIRAMLDVSGDLIDRAAIADWAQTLGLASIWDRFAEQSSS